MNFIISASISLQDFPDTLRSIFANCFWKTFFVVHKKCIFLNMSAKLKELLILLKCREPFEKFISVCTAFVLKILVFHNFFKGFWQLYFKNINFLTITKRCLYNDCYESKTKMTGKDKQNHIFQKSKSYEISSTDIYIGEDQDFIIHVFYWCIPLNHKIYIY